MENFINRVKADLKRDKLAGILCHSLLEGFMISFDRQIVCCNKNLADIFGYRERELEGKEITIIFPGVTKEEVRRCSGKEGAILTGRKKDGSSVVVRARSVDISYKDKKIQFFAIQDLTEAEKYRQVIKESEERYRVLTESMLDGILLTDANGRIIYANPVALEMFGFRDIRKYRRRPFLTLYSPSLLKGQRQTLNLSLLEKESFLLSTR